jgi:hypothetical protein
MTSLRSCLTGTHMRTEEPFFLADLADRTSVANVANVAKRMAGLSPGSAADQLRPARIDGEAEWEDRAVPPPAQQPGWRPASAPEPVQPLHAEPLLNSKGLGRGPLRRRAPATGRRR